MNYLKSKLNKDKIVNEEKVIKIAIKIREKVILFCFILFIRITRLIQ
jgi:hypothetical protein